VDHVYCFLNKISGNVKSSIWWEH